METKSISQKIFNYFNSVLLTLVAMICLVPFIHILAVSFSSNAANMSGNVLFTPKEFTFEAYRFLVRKSEFFSSLWIALKRVIVGTTVQMLVTILTAYPLSKDKSRFKYRLVFVWIFLITMFFNGGLMSNYMVMRELNLINSFWVLVLPGALNVWYVIMMMNFFRTIPSEIEEAALVDGCGQFRMLKDIYLPISLPSLATILLFTMVGHWNSWFDGIIYLDSPENYPLQSYLYTIIMSTDLTNVSNLSMEQLERLKSIGDLNLRSAQIFLGALPIMLVYPFLQKYFVKGIIVGSIKG